MKNILIIAATRAELPPIEGAIVVGLGKKRAKKAIARQNEYLCKLDRFIFA